MTFDPDTSIGGVQLDQGNLRTNYPSWYSGIYATSPALKSGRYYIELEVGPTYGSYAAYGFFEKIERSLSEVMDYGIGVDLNKAVVKGFGWVHKDPWFQIKLADGTTYTQTTQQGALAIDFNKRRIWVGTSPSKGTKLTWFPDNAGYDFSKEKWDGETPMSFLVMPSATSGQPHFHARFSEKDWIWEPPSFLN